jgi:hypothetical protein
MAVGWPNKTTYATGDVYQASDVNDTNGTINLLGASVAYAAGKNNLLNGNMQIAQRGTSFTGVTNQVYPADRYWFETSGAGTYTVTNESDAPTVLGQSKCVKVLVTTANASPGASAYTVFQSAIEGQASQFLAKGTASAQISTISFWTKSNKTGTYSFLLYDAVNARAFGANYTVSVSGTWEKKTITVPADLTGTITNNNSVGIRLYWNLNAGSNHTGGSVLSAWGAFSFGTNWMPNQTNIAANLNNYWQITGIQWELGSTATAFQTATGTIQGELAACQRYYIRFANIGGQATPLVFGGTSSAYVYVPGLNQMRTTPSTATTYTNAAYNTALGAGQWCFGVDGSGFATKSGTVSFNLRNAGVAFAGATYSLTPPNFLIPADSTLYIEASAEL